MTTNDDLIARLQQQRDERGDLIAEAITEHFGARCDDDQPGCMCCDAWHQYDRLREADAKRIETLEEENSDWQAIARNRMADADAAEARVKVLEDALRALLDCPHIAERDMEPAWMEPATEVAISIARAALEG